MASIRGIIGVNLAIILAAINVEFAHATCNQFEIIYARGSGQLSEAKPGESGFQTEREALKSSIAKSLSSQNYTFTELNASQLGLEGQYEAVPVVGEGMMNGAVAVVSAAQFGKYFSSMNGGVKLLSEYISRQKSLYPEQCFILTGYSQGAHVIGQYLDENSTNPEVIGKIKYVGLLGDPKLDLDGIGTFPGSDIPWYRGTAVPLVQGGLLQARKPYLPHQNNKLLMPAGSWCFNDDIVCSGNIITASSTAHGEYPNNAIPQMAMEIANVINNPLGIVDGSRYASETCGPAKQDIVVLLDTSPMMRREASLFTDTPMYYGAKNGQTKTPTAGEMFTRVGCGDTRVAVVGYGRAQDGPPKLLLDFTKDAKQYDALMKSLYSPASSGNFTRTQFREGVLSALDVDWRFDAARTVFAITDIGGSGPIGSEGWRGWENSLVANTYLKDPLSQEVIAKARLQDAVVLGIPVTHSYGNFTPAAGEDYSGTDAHKYLKLMSKVTGGYMWVRQMQNLAYASYDFKYSLLDDTINYPMKIREQTTGFVASARGEVGKPMTLKFNDSMSLFAAAKLRAETVTYEWFVDCSDKTRPVYEVAQTITFTPTKSGKCQASVIPKAQRTGAGCYLSCPEPFPPYLYKAISFTIDIKPSNYTPLVPGQITGVQKYIYNDKVVYTWAKPTYSGSEDIVYLARETDGTVLASTTTRELVITDTARTDPMLTISAMGVDGESSRATTVGVDSLDLRTPVAPPVIEVEPIVGTEPPEDEGSGLEEIIPEPELIVEDIDIPLPVVVVPDSLEVPLASLEPTVLIPQLVLASGANNASVSVTSINTAQSSTRSFTEQGSDISLMTENDAVPARGPVLGIASVAAAVSPVVASSPDQLKLTNREELYWTLFIVLVVLLITAHLTKKYINKQ